MHIKHVALQNWRNFKKAEIDLTSRTFIAGANASGKSNFLDAFRFLKDLANSGLKEAVEKRGGISKVRCLYARRPSEIEIAVEIEDGKASWKYEIGIGQEQGGIHRPIITKEFVHKNGQEILKRPGRDEKKDPELKTQTALEQISSNADFRELAKFFKEISYLHIIPQIIRHPKFFPWQGDGEDYFGWTLVKKISSTTLKTQKRKLEKIERALTDIVPNLKELNLTEPDSDGNRHLEVRFQHWREKGARQNEMEFSDGTLRLIGLFWALLDGKGLLLMEEPELYLHSSIIRKLPRLIHRLQKSAGNRQVVITTHSPELLLKANGIGPEEILLLKQGEEATNIEKMTDIEDSKPLLENDVEYDEIIEQHTKPESIEKLDLFINQI